MNTTAVDAPSGPTPPRAARAGAAPHSTNSFGGTPARHVEVIDGEVKETPMPQPLHGQVCFPGRDSSRWLYHAA